MSQCPLENTGIQPHGEDASSANDNSDRLAKARARISELFQSIGLWWETDEGNPKTDESQATAFASSAVEIVGLLEDFPSLASEKFEICYYCDGEVYKTPPVNPLVAFARKNFDSAVLDKIYSCHPDAHDRLMKKSFHNVWANDFSWTTLQWIAQHIRSEADAAECIFNIIPREYVDELGHPGFEKTLEILLSKSPKISREDERCVKLLQNLIAIGINSGTLKRIVKLIPVEGRVLDVSCDFGDDIGFEDFWEFDDSETGQIADVMPDLSALTVDYRCLPDDLVDGIIDRIAACPNLQSLTVKIPSELHVIQPQSFATVLSLFHQRPKMTRLTLIVDGSGDSLDIAEEELESSLGIDYQAMTSVADPMLSINNICLRLIIEALRSRPSTQKSQLSGLQQIELECMKQDESMWYLFRAVPSVILRHIEVGLSQTGHLCKIWNRKCPLDQGNSALQVAFRTCRHLYDKRIERAALSIDFRQPPKLVELYIRGCGKNPGADITRALIGLVGIGTLRHLRFTNSASHIVHLAEFCEALKRDYQLKCLELDGVDFRRQDNRSVSEWFLEALESSPAKQLSALFLRSEDTYHFVSQGERNLVCPDSARTSYQCTPQVQRIQYLLWLNKFGRESLSNGKASMKEWADKLAIVCALSRKDLSHDGCHCLLVSSDTQEEEKRLSILYGLLHASPSSWCLTSKRLCSPEKGIKRKFLELQ